MSKTMNKISLEVRERAVGLVLDNEGRHGSSWQAVMSIAAKIGCSAHTLNEWVKKSEVDSGKRAGVFGEIAERIKALDARTASCARVRRIRKQSGGLFSRRTRYCTKRQRILR